MSPLIFRKDPTSTRSAAPSSSAQERSPFNEWLRLSDASAALKAQSIESLSSKERSLLALMIAVLLHLLALWQAPLLFSLTSDRKPPTLPIKSLSSEEWERLKNSQALLMDPNPSARSEDEIQTPPKEARVFSERSRNVKKETVRREPSPPLEQLGLPLPAAPRSAPGSQSLPPQESERQQNASRGASPSYWDESVASGSETILKAQESVYYSFYSRLSESVGSLWRSWLNSTVRASSLQPRDYETAVQVILDDQGHLLDVQVMESSGIPFLDQGVIQAWKRVPRYPNPPKGLLNEKGQVVMGWRFLARIRNGAGFEFQELERTF